MRRSAQQATPLAFAARGEEMMRAMRVMGRGNSSSSNSRIQELIAQRLPVAFMGQSGILFITARGRS